jgi:cytochrome c oxidase assembly protein subunit 15
VSPSAPNLIDRVRNLTLTRNQYFVIAAVALGSLAAIVLTGSAVRLTGSGLGCPDWPRCYEDRVVPEADLNAVIEFANRLFTGFVGVAVIAASVLAFRRRPFRWHLALFGALLPLGVVCQAILGAIVVEYDLKPELVMGHFILSMLLLDASFALAWCARYEPGERPASTDRLGVWAVRGLIPLGQLTIIAGTIATGSGPHPGDHEDELVQRFDFEGGYTLQWVVERHSVLAAAFGIAAIGVWFLLRRRGGERRALRPLTVLIGLLALQGVVGAVQWAAELPAAIVWVHVALATLTWLAMLWTVAVAGRVAPRGAAAPRAIAGPAPAGRSPEGVST